MADAASSGARVGAGAGGGLDLDRWLETLRKGEHLPEDAMHALCHHVRPRPRSSPSPASPSPRGRPPPSLPVAASASARRRSGADVRSRVR